MQKEGEEAKCARAVKRESASSRSNPFWGPALPPHGGFAGHGGDCDESARAREWLGLRHDVAVICRRHTSLSLPTNRLFPLSRRGNPSRTPCHDPVAAPRAAPLVFCDAPNGVTPIGFRGPFHDRDACSSASRKALSLWLGRPHQGCQVRFGWLDGTIWFVSVVQAANWQLSDGIAWLRACRPQGVVLDLRTQGHTRPACGLGAYSTQLMSCKKWVGAMRDDESDYSGLQAQLP